MGGKGSGRLNVTDSILKKASEKKTTPVSNDVMGGDFILPNQSGDHSAGHVKTPTNDTDIANKKYVDDSAGGVSAHSALTELDYASAGHTGFAQSSHSHTHASTTGQTANDHHNETHNADLHSDIDTTTDTPSKNEVLKWNGSNWVPAVYNASFTFSIASFSDGQSYMQLIGSGVWKAIGAITFTASYNNGPPNATPYVSLTGWSNLNMTGAGYVGPTNSAEAVDYPGAIGSKTFTLHATDGETPDTDNETIYFYNYMWYGKTVKTDTYTEADIEGLATNELTNDNTQVWDSVTTGAGEYMLFAFPTRLGIPAFWVGGFEGGFEAPETVGVTNSAGFTENYYAWRSTNANLGATVVETK